jgi:hypothetical protein
MRFGRSGEQALQKMAAANGQKLREWARDVLLCVVVNDSHAEVEMHIFTEIVGIQMLLMSALDPLLRGGEKMAPEARPPFAQSRQRRLHEPESFGPSGSEQGKCLTEHRTPRRSGVNLPWAHAIRNKQATNRNSEM